MASGRGQGADEWDDKSDGLRMERRYVVWDRPDRVERVVEAWPGWRALWRGCGGIQFGWRGCEVWPSWRRLGAWPGPLRGLSAVRDLVQLSSLPPAAAQMVITDLTAPAERPAALGRLGLCFGVGMIFGSLLGGTLSTKYG